DYSLFVANAAFEQAGLPVPSTAKALTYADMRELAGKLTKRDGDHTLRMGYGYPADMFVRGVQGILASRGEKLYKPDFSAVVLSENPAAVEILRYFHDISKENITWNPLNPSPSWIGEDFLKGALGICHFGYWYSAMISASQDSAVKDNVTMLPAPS